MIRDQHRWRRRLMDEHRDRCSERMIVNDNRTVSTYPTRMLPTCPPGEDLLANAQAVSARHLLIAFTGSASHTPLW